MRHDTPNNKKHAYYFVIIILAMLFFYNFNFTPNKLAYAEGSKESIEDEFISNTEDVLDKIDSSELDDFLQNDFNLEFFDVGSVKDLVVSVLDGNYFVEYNSLLEAVLNLFKSNIKELLSIFIMFLSIVLLHEMFNNFCVDKYADLKKAIKVIFSMFIVLLLSFIVKDVATSITDTITKIFNFTKVLFPILLTLISLSGAVGTHSVYSSLSVFLLNTGSYVFLYVLLPLSASILVLSLIGSIFSNKRFERTIGIFKWIFKIVIGVMFAVFGLFSMVNMFTASAKDGVTLKLTKFAIKNYIPILGGYISEGFDFVHACSVLIKNAFGICGILIMFIFIIKPLVLYFAYILTFKVLSLFVSYVGSGGYSDMFENVSKCLGCFVTVLVGVFLIMFIFVFLLIFSVSVV